MKKLTAICCAMILLGSCMTAFGGCGNVGGNPKTEPENMKEAGAVMNVSLNPEVEFVLDKENNVVSVNALNEEGNVIVSNATFTGKSAEEAVELFVQVADETGFLFEGKIAVGENQLSISISGDEEKAQEIYADVKEKVTAYFTEMDIQGQIEMAEMLTREELQKVVTECAPYIDAAEAKALSYKEMIETIAAARKETAEIYSQELKNAYYEAKAFAVQQAEYEVLKTHMNDIQKAICDAAFANYQKAVEDIEAIRLENLVDEDSSYQKALKDFQDAKATYLNYREYISTLAENEITSLISTTLASYETALTATETALLTAGQMANATLDMSKATAKSLYDVVINAIGSYSTMMEEYATEVSASVTAATNACIAQFETEYQASIADAQQSWEDMLAKIQAPTTSEGTENE